MNKVDKEIKNYLDRARKLATTHSKPQEHSGVMYYKIEREVIEIAKMIQNKEE